MRLTEQELRLIIRESLKNPDMVLDEGILSTIGGWLKSMFSGVDNVKPAKDPKTGLDDVKQSMSAYILSVMEANKADFKGKKEKELKAHSVKVAKAAVDKIFAELTK